MQADLTGEHRLQICMRISSSSTDSICNYINLPHLEKKKEKKNGKKKREVRLKEG